MMTVSILQQTRDLGNGHDHSPSTSTPPPSSVPDDPVPPTQFTPPPSSVPDDPVPPTQFTPPPSSVPDHPVPPTQFTPPPPSSVPDDPPLHSSTPKSTVSGHDHSHQDNELTIHVDLHVNDTSNDVFHHITSQDLFKGSDVSIMSSMHVD